MRMVLKLKSRDAEVGRNRKAPGGPVVRPSAHGSSPRHCVSAPANGLDGLRRQTRGARGYSAGRAPPAVTLNPCRRVNVNTFPRRPWSPLQAAAGRRPSRWASAATVARETLSSHARDQTLRPSVLRRSQAPGTYGRVGVHGLGPRTSRAPGCESRAPGCGRRAPGCGRRALGRQSGAPSCEIRSRGYKDGVPGYESRARGYKDGVPGYESRAPGCKRGAAGRDREAAACGEGTAETRK